MRFQVVFEGRVIPLTSDAGVMPPDALEAQLDEVMGELLVLGADDATVSATLARGEVEISVSVEAESLEEAGKSGGGLIRSAIHAAGGFTPNWSIDWASVTTSKTRLPDEQGRLVDA